MEGAHRVRGFVLGSWTRLLIAAGIILALWAVFIGLAISGRLGELRYLNVPLLHPYPPAGYVQNPWNTGDKGDLISQSEANQVRADLLKDGPQDSAALARMRKNVAKRDNMPISSSMVVRGKYVFQRKPVIAQSHHII